MRKENDNRKKECEMLRDLLYKVCLNLVKFIMCTLVYRIHMTFHIPTKGYTVTENQGTHDKLDRQLILAVNDRHVAADFKVDH